jgi:uroporphyrinogen decarboxylase
LTIPSPFIQHSQSLRGFQDWYMDLVLRPDRAEALFDAVLEVTVRMTENILKAAGDLADVVMTADDIGGQQGLLFSYDHYLRFIKPRHKKFFQLVRDLTPAKILLHCCGSITRILDDLIELGVDAVNPVQTSAAGMDPVQLKKKCGDRMSFWGGIDTQQTLPFGSVEDVKKMVEQRIEELGEGGGYVLCAVHNIQPDVPLENILVMYRHAREYVPSYVK